MSFNDEINKLAQLQDLQTSQTAATNNDVQAPQADSAPSAQAIQQEEDIKPVTAPTAPVVPVPSGDKNQSDNVAPKPAPASTVTPQAITYNGKQYTNNSDLVNAVYNDLSSHNPTAVKTAQYFIGANPDGNPQAKTAAAFNNTFGSIGQMAYTPGKGLALTPAQSANTTSTATTNTNQPNIVNPFKGSLSDEQYQALSKVATDSQIYNWLHPTSSTSNILQQLYETNIKKPDAPNEDSLNKARTVANIGDALGSLAELISGANGATIEKRDMSKSATAQQDSKEEAIRALYNKDLDEYNKGHMNSQYQDYMNNLQQAAANREAMLGALKNGYTIENDQKKTGIDQQNADTSKQKMVNDNNNTIADLAERTRNDKANNSVAQQNATTSRKEYNLNQQKYDDSQETDVKVGSKIYQDFPISLANQVSARAIHDGIVSKVPQTTYNPLTGQKSTDMVPVTESTKLTPEQIQFITSTYGHRYVEGLSNGKWIIREHATPANTTAFDEAKNNNSSSSSKWY